ncbi:DMT family transporter [Paenibacillus sp. FJAT-27812]|uniref:DMT family transporter n=1 Tax=Paenibacillus sp. FJAT-27812 TaxID=1684143 RepID=UPI000A66C51D
MNKYKYMSLIVVTTLLMGIAFPIGKIGLNYAPPFFLMGLRYVLAGGLLALIVAKRPRPRGRKQWLQAVVIGLFQTAAVMGCVYYSMYWITSSESAIITSISPLIVIIIATLFAGAIYSRRQWLGVVLGFIGVAFVRSPSVAPAGNVHQLRRGSLLRCCDFVDQALGSRL